MRQKGADGMENSVDPASRSSLIWVYSVSQKVNRKIQEEPEAEATANPRHQEEEKKWHRLTCA